MNWVVAKNTRGSAMTRKDAMDHSYQDSVDEDLFQILDGELICAQEENKEK